MRKLSPNTQKVYSRALADFTAWCDNNGFNSFPAEPIAVSEYLSSVRQSGAAPSKMAQARAAIAFKHESNGYDSPTLTAMVRNTVADLASRHPHQLQQKQAATSDLLQLILEEVDTETLQGKRDAAILLLGFAGAFRRSELVAITVEDLTFSDQGVDVFLPKSKTDQEAKGQSVAIYNGRTFQPIDSLREWLRAARIISGPLFRRFVRNDHPTSKPLSAQSVALIVKKYAEAAGIGPDEFSAESLRAGFVVSQLALGRSLQSIGAVTRHSTASRTRGLGVYCRGTPEAILGELD